jgi:hypothetical protein
MEEEWLVENHNHNTIIQIEIKTKEDKLLQEVEVEDLHIILGNIIIFKFIIIIPKKSNITRKRKQQWSIIITMRSRVIMKRKPVMIMDRNKMMLEKVGIEMRCSLLTRNSQHQGAALLFVFLMSIMSVFYRMLVVKLKLRIMMNGLITMREQMD